MVLLFSLAMFLSALLLFLVQPMFAKMALPLLGGTPAVWNTCMVFYQAVLLAGYAYAHWSAQFLGVRRQALLHLALLAAVLAVLPIEAARGWTPPAAGNPVPWLLMLLAVSVGLPFFVLSATAPMLQKWFAQTPHPAAPDPYFLYGASNLGSMAALLSYPVLVEPYLRLARQSWAWAGGYLLFALLLALCALVLWKSPRPMAEPAASGAPENPAAPPPAMSRRLWWVVLSLVPSSLLLAVTTYISTDIAAVPLLWIIPLTLYLLTFVLVFARRPLLSHRWMVRLMPLAVIPLAVIFSWGLKWWFLFPVHLAAFFIIAMVCHGELMARRPDTAHLTEYYLWISAGGVLGGLFTALVAPLVFKNVVEYPLMLLAACLLKPATPSRPASPWTHWFDLLWPLALALSLAATVRVLVLPGLPGKVRLFGIIFAPLAAGIICHHFSSRPLRFALALGAILLVPMSHNPQQPLKVIHQDRNFFGVLEVKHDPKGNYHWLTHGTTLHGAQSLDPARRREPLTYFTRTGPLGQVFEGFSPRHPQARIAVVGLGAGATASYLTSGQKLVFYEIDPAVTRVARDHRFFTFLADCPGRVEVVMGDARLSLKDAPDAHFDLFILDAFSSDSIPVHLVTREALALYLDKTREPGLLVFHISNRYLDLKPVLANLARDRGLICLARGDTKLDEKEKKELKTPSEWVVMARHPESLDWLAADPRWRRLAGAPGETLWTDDFSNILTVFKWRSWR